MSLRFHSAQGIHLQVKKRRESAFVGLVGSFVPVDWMLCLCGSDKHDLLSLDRREFPHVGALPVYHMQCVLHLWSSCVSLVEIKCSVETHKNLSTLNIRFGNSVLRSRLGVIDWLAEDLDQHESA